MPSASTTPVIVSTSRRRPSRTSRIASSSPDDSLQYEGRQIDNVRVPINDDPLIRDLIAAAEEFYEVTNRGELAEYHGELVLTPEMKRILERRQKLELDILKKYYARS
jgi:hypothetical protein